MAPITHSTAGGLGAGYVRTRDGVDLWVRDWRPDREQQGSPGPVVFVASWSLPSDSWAYQMLPLVDAGVRCVAFDRRGHGRSADPGGGYDFDTVADDLADVLEALDLRNVTLVGHSMGPGEIVRNLSRHGAARVARFVMLGTITPTLVATGDGPACPDPAVFEAFRRTELMRDFPKWLDDNAAPFLTPETSPGMTQWVKAMAAQASLKALYDLHRHITSADFTAELRAVPVPVLVVHGDRDVTCPLALAERTAALLPHGRLRVYEGAPHGLFLTHAERLNRDLLAFVRGEPLPEE